MNSINIERIANVVRPILDTDESSLYAWIAGGWEPEDDREPNLPKWKQAASQCVAERGTWLEHV